MIIYLNINGRKSFIAEINPFKSNEISRPYQLGESISNIKVVE